MIKLALKSTLFPYTTLFRSGVADRLARDRLGHLPDLVRVVLDPARLGEVLLELAVGAAGDLRSEEHTTELQSRRDIVCRLLLEKKNHSPLFIKNHKNHNIPP